MKLTKIAMRITITILPFDDLVLISNTSKDGSTSWCMNKLRKLQINIRETVLYHAAPSDRVAKVRNMPTQAKLKVADNSKKEIFFGRCLLVLVGLMDLSSLVL